MVLTPAPKAHRSVVAATILGVIGSILYALMVMNAAAAPSLESIDKGVAAIYALIAGVLLWIVLAALLLVGASRGSMPDWGAAAAFILHPLAGIAAFVGLFVLTEGRDAPSWPLLAITLLPPLLAAYAFWAHFPSCHAYLPAVPTGGVLWGLVLLLSVGQLGYSYVYTRAAAERSREAAEAYRQETERQEAAKAAENQARFERLTPDSPLQDWQDFIGKGNALEKQAIAAARILSHRQSDAEAMLDAGNGFPLYHIDDLDLHPTQGFCTSTSKFLMKVAADNRPSASDRPFVLDAASFETWLPTMRWLAGQHCELGAALTALQQAASAYPPSEERDKYLGELARLDPQWLICDGANDAPASAKITACSQLLTVEQNPANRAIIFFSRGGAYLDADQIKAAITDYDEAISLKPDFAEAYNNRGNAYDAQGAHDRAIEDYDQALRIAPTFAIAFNNRGNTFAETAEYDAAIKDFDRAISLRPRYRNAIMNRGRALYFRGDFAAATDNFVQALALEPSDSYAALWRYLAATRGSVAAMDQLHQDAARLDRSAWPWPIVAVYLGERDATDVMRTARDHASDQLCDASFYLGERSVVVGDPAGGRDLLQQATLRCSLDTIEHYEAAQELEPLH